MSFSFGAPPRPRRPNLTPMIDVVFLLLVFFMLASRFGSDMVVPLTLAGTGGTYAGPPRLVDIHPDALSLNGVAVDGANIAGRLAPLMSSDADMVVLRARDGADLQRVIAVMERLEAAGFSRLVLVE
ncbi:Biopolymer transport protein ExbD/TolR [Rhodovulum sp. P5]|uniref:ExbD/TolR family protein n=1 Tax=Rhodovulum sp. P5 TaxID=1564506 RepID=UPI0009C21B06|nr:biopolymer transporter ExbD [Rhodovulum sp. P5]ARE39821.1 Biopolymer transport protein ExbD/TolR [Rhodovulum sp. P5]